MLQLVSGISSMHAKNNACLMQDSDEFSASPESGLGSWQYRFNKVRDERASKKVIRSRKFGHVNPNGWKKFRPWRCCSGDTNIWGTNL